MTGRRSWRKGKRGEREAFNLLNERLGRPVFSRNLIQTRQGGCDSDTDSPFAIEVKRQEKLLLTPWVQQMREQAREAGKQGVLMYRRNGEQWHVLVDMTIDQFIEYIEARMPTCDESKPS